MLEKIELPIFLVVIYYSTYTNPEKLSSIITNNYTKLKLLVSWDYSTDSNQVGLRRVYSKSQIHLNVLLRKERTLKSLH